MKHLLLAATLLLPMGAATQTATPPKDATTIILQSTDSARVAYNKVIKNLALAGYAIDRTDKDALFVGTTPKAAENAVYVKLYFVANPTPTGSEILCRGTFTWVNSITIAAHVENTEVPIQYRSNGPVGKAWRGLVAGATAALPSATVNYK